MSPFPVLFLSFLHADALAFIFFGTSSFGLPEFFFLGIRALAFVQHVLLSGLRVGLAALSCSLAGFEAMFCVAWVGADATGRNEFL